MPDIVLTTLNAKYIHTAFGLRYLLANLGPLRPRASIIEFDIHQRPADIVEVLLAQNPKIIGLGIYIWNVAPATELVALLKRVQPDIAVVLGGPEVSYEVEDQPIVKLADHVITGEADLKFAEVCRAILTDENGLARSGDHQVLSRDRHDQVNQHLPKIIASELPEFSHLILPYDLYGEEDVAHRIIYVEASRGCPFTCEFCLSSLDIPVRQVPLPILLAELEKLLDRGVRQFKFVDRTFNLNLATSRAILEFFLKRHRAGNLYHFEMVPDRLPEALREVIAKFPPGALQFEVGIQTFNQEVTVRIQRRQDYERLEENLRFLRRETGVHIHADLIAGLPGESVESFAAGFDRLIALRPHEIQVGILKRLRGTPIVRHDAEWQVVYSPHPPYEILQNKLIDFATLQRLRRFARYWDLVGNSGNFVETTPLIWSAMPAPPASEPGQAICTAVAEPARAAMPGTSPFAAFLRWSEWLHARVGRTDSIALPRLMEFLLEFLTVVQKHDARSVAETLWRDYQRGGRRDPPPFLKSLLPGRPRLTPRPAPPLPKRQARHVAA